MPVLVNNQTGNTTNNDQQEQIYEQDTNSSIDGQTNHAQPPTPEVNQRFFFFFYYFYPSFKVNLLKLLDEPIEANGDVIGLFNHTQQQQHQQTLNPLEDLLFGNGIQTNHSTNSNFIFFGNKI